MNDDASSPIALRIVKLARSLRPGLGYAAVTVEILYEHGSLELVLRVARLPTHPEEPADRPTLRQAIEDFADRLKAAAQQPIPLPPPARPPATRS